MIKIGGHNELEVVKQTKVGLFLADEAGTEILLPNKYVPEDAQTGDTLRVFCYLDHEERPVATTLEPFIKRDEFGLLQVAEVNEIGAFLDWGLEKHLLAPFREQQIRMEEGKWYVVYCSMDQKSSRLYASSRLDRFLSNQDMDLHRGEEVSLLVSRKTNLGWELIVNNRHKGLVYNDEVYRELSPGDVLTGYVKKIREDNNLDISLTALGHLKLEPSAEKVYLEMMKQGGVLKLHDRSSPDEIREQLAMSKKTFKKAVGVLYKARKIVLKDDGIYAAGQKKSKSQNKP